MVRRFVAKFLDTVEKVSQTNCRSTVIEPLRELGANSLNDDFFNSILDSSTAWMGRFPSVDAPFQARENVGVVDARGRMLSSVRPLTRQEDSRRPVWEFAGRVQITHSVLEAQWKALVVPARLADCCAILSFRSPLRPRDRGQPRPPRPEFCRCRL